MTANLMTDSSPEPGGLPALLCCLRCHTDINLVLCKWSLFECAMVTALAAMAVDNVGVHAEHFLNRTSPPLE